MTSAQHAVPTALFAAIGYFCSVGIGIILSIVFFGVLIDVEHLSIRRIKKIRRGEKGPVEGWTNFMHTWQFLVIVCVISYFLGNYLPAISYSIHILMDAGCKDNAYQKSSPLPVSLYKFIPQWLRYEQKGMFF